MADALEQIIVEYKLDVSTLKQQFEQIKTEMHGLKSTAEASAKEAGGHIKTHIGKGVDDTKQSFKSLGKELKQALSAAHSNEAVKQLLNIDKAAKEVSKQVKALERELAKNNTQLKNTAQDAAKNNTAIEKLSGKIAANESQLKSWSEAGKQNEKQFQKMAEKTSRWRTELEGLNTKAQKFTEQANSLNQKAVDTTTKLNQVKTATTGLSVLSSTTQLVKGLETGFNLGGDAAKLFGDKSEALEGKINKGKEAMKLAKDATALFSDAKKMIAGLTDAQTLATTSQTAAEETGTATKGAATTAQMELNAAMDANPVGAVIAVVMGLVAAIGFLISKTKDATEAQKKLNDAHRAETDIIKDKLDMAKARDDDAVKAAERNLETLKAHHAAVADLKKAEEDLDDARIKAASNQMQILGISAENYNKYKDENISAQNELVNKIAELQKAGKKEEAEEAQKSLEDLKERLNLAQQANSDYEDAKLKKLQDTAAEEDKVKNEMVKKDKNRQDKKLGQFSSYVDNLKKKANDEVVDADLADLNAENGALENNLDKLCKCDTKTADDKKEKGDEKDTASKESPLTKTLENVKSKSQEAIKVMADVSKVIFSNALEQVKTEFALSQAELNAWHDKALQSADGNAKKQAAIARLYHAEQLKMAHDKAVQEAEIARKQAEMNKAQKLIEIIIQTAVNVSKYTGDLPAALPLLAGAVATGAAEAATVSAQPLPPIPKFATGVVGFKGQGTETSDSNPVFISHNESIISAAATKKYGQELEAINSLQFENLLLEKYLLPVLKSNSASASPGTTYDDWLLRKEIREGNYLNKKSMEYLKTMAGSAISREVWAMRYGA